MMNVVSMGDKGCERIRRYFDSYIDDELLIETNHEVLRHLATCAECTRILEERIQLKRAVKQTVSAQAAPATLLHDIKRAIAEEEQRSFFPAQFKLPAAIAAMLILVLGGVLMLRTIGLRNPGSSDTGGFFQAISAEARQIMKIGLADHIHCTLELGTWKEVISFERMKEATGITALGPEFINIVPLVEQKLGPDFQFIQAHRCTIEGRDYVHLIATGENGIILSLVITRKNGESIGGANTTASAAASGVAIYRDNQEQLEIAAFETDRFLAFVVSNLASTDNLKVTSDLAPAVSEFLSRVRS